MVHDHFFSQFVYIPTTSEPHHRHPHVVKESLSSSQYLLVPNKNDTKHKKYSNKKERRKAPSFTAAERRSEPYRRVPHDHPWIPPPSPYRLLQEYYYQDPWKVLVICGLCNRTRGAQACKVIPELFSLCPSAEAAVNVPVEMVEEIIKCLGLQKKRALDIKRLSMEYLRDWTYVTELHSVGKYAADAYAIFCSGHWRNVFPIDHKLVNYWWFLHQNENSSTAVSVSTL